MAERQEQAAPDAVLTRIGQVVMLHHGGDREEARSRFLDLWVEIGEDGDPLHRCTLAHYLADTQDDPGDELAWDLRALSAAEELAGGRARTATRPASRDSSRRCTSTWPPTTSSSAVPRPPAAICAAPAAPRAPWPTTATARGSGPRSAGWRCGSARRALRVPTAGARPRQR
ncbi:hypothetical protein GCM10017687_84090 [Streptomyces echinatus]